MEHCLLQETDKMPYLLNYVETAYGEPSSGQSKNSFPHGLSRQGYIIN